MKVSEALRIFKEHHNVDPRCFLNNYFWSVLVHYKFTNHFDECPAEIESWCKEQFDESDSVIIGRKIWFTHQWQYAQFWLTWEEYLDKD